MKISEKTSFYSLVKLYYFFTFKLDKTCKMMKI